MPFQHFGDIHDLDLLAQALGTDGIIEHQQAVWAGGGNHLGLHLERIAQAAVIDARVGIGFQPHLPAATAAAEAVLAVAGQLHRVHASLRQQLARGGIDLVVASQVARVRVCQAAFRQRCLAMPIGSDLLYQPKLGKILGVMLDLIVELTAALGAQLRIFILEGVEAVRALGDDAVEFHLAQGLDVLFGHHLEHVLVAQAAGGLAAAAFVKAEHREIYAGLLQQAHKGAGDFLVALVEGEGAAQEEQHIGLLAGGQLTHLQALAPGHTFFGGHAPGVALAFQVAQGIGNRFGQLAGGERQVAAQVNHLVHRVDEDRAARLAGPTGGAGPGQLNGQRFSEQLVDVAGLVGLPKVVEHDLAQRLDQGARRIVHAADIGRADFFTAPAAHTGIEGEQLLGSEFADLANAQLLGLVNVLDLFEGAGLAQRAEEHVQRGEHQVAQLGERDAGHQQHADSGMRPYQWVVQRGGAFGGQAQGAQQAGCQAANRRPGCPGRVSGQQAAAFGGKADQRDQPEQHQGVDVIPLCLQGLWPGHQAAEQGHPHPQQDGNPGQVHHQLRGQVKGVAREGQLDKGDEQLHLHQVDDRSNHLEGDAPEDHEVHHAGVQLLEDAHLGDGMHHEVAQARPEAAPACAEIGAGGKGEAGEGLAGHSVPPM